MDFFSERKSEVPKLKQLSRKKIVMPFDLISSRKELWPIQKGNKFAPIYKPNFNYCKKRLDSLCIPFNKVSLHGHEQDLNRDIFINSGSIPSIKHVHQSLEAQQFKAFKIKKNEEFDNKRATNL